MDITTDILALVADAAAVRASAISPSTEIWNDLRIGGDDLDELLLAFQKKFGVNLDGVDIRIYAPDEAGVILFNAWDWLAPKLNLKKAKFPSLTIADLIRAAQTRAWSKSG